MMSMISVFMKLWGGRTRSCEQTRLGMGNKKLYGIFDRAGILQSFLVYQKDFISVYCLLHPIETLDADKLVLIRVI